STKIISWRSKWWSRAIPESAASNWSGAWKIRATLLGLVSLTNATSNRPPAIMRRWTLSPSTCRRRCRSRRPRQRPELKAPKRRIPSGENLMPDLRQTRRNIKNALGVLLGVDLVAVIVLFSPLIGSTNSRRQELNRLWVELQVKTRQVEPLKNLPQKVVLANRQITDFYQTRFPAHDSQIATEFGKLAAADGVPMNSAKYKATDVGPALPQRIGISTTPSGNYVSLAR